MSASPPIPEISVVIVSHNGERIIGRCLEALARELDSIPSEVFVIDSASTDGTVDAVRRHQPPVLVRLCRENVGFSAANNLALRECRGRRLLLLNPDTVVSEGSISGLLRQLDEHPEAGAVGPALHLPDGTIQVESARRLPTTSNLLPWLLLLDKLEWRLRFGGRCAPSRRHPRPGTAFDRMNLLAWCRDRSCEVESISGACMLLRREAVDQVGALDEAAPMYLDDIDYCRRLRDRGWRIRFAADVSVAHEWQHSSRRLNREGDFYALVCHSIWLYLRKHDGPAAALGFSLSAALAALLRSALCLPPLALDRGARRLVWQRQWRMASGLRRWALRIPKRPPRLGFAGESSAGRSAGSPVR